MLHKMMCDVPVSQAWHGSNYILWPGKTNVGSTVFRSMCNQLHVFKMLFTR